MIDRETAGALWLQRDHDPRARAELIIGYRSLATMLAGRFAGRGETIEDLAQAATLGLINAIDRFDPTRGVEFTTFASATIVGELKRHLRDRGWSVRVPRGLQERALLVGHTRDLLYGRLGRAPTVAEIAGEAGLSAESVIEALQAGQAYLSLSLEAPLGAEDGADSLSDLLEEDGEALALAERLAVIAPAVRALPARERRILFLRFYRDLTQAEIAAELGMSQMHVSRLLGRALDAIRRTVAASEVEPPPGGTP